MFYLYVVKMSEHEFQTFLLILYSLLAIFVCLSISGETAVLFSSEVALHITDRVETQIFLNKQRINLMCAPVICKMRLEKRLDNKQLNCLNLKKTIKTTSG